MTKTSGAPATFTKPAESPDVDYCREIVQTLDKDPQDHVKCVRVFGDFYRCNWWAPAGPAEGRGGMFEGLELSTYRVRKSQLVRARLQAGQLIVDDATYRK